MSAIILALLSSLSWGTADFLGGTISRRLSVIKVLAISQLFGLLCMCVAATAFGSWDADTGYIPWAIGASVSGSLGLGLFYLALATGTMSVVSPITTLGAVIPLLWGYANGERPSVMAVIGIVVALVGVVLASGPEISGESGVKPVLLAVAAAIGFGIALLCFAGGSQYDAVMTITATRLTTALWLGAGAIACLLLPRLRARVLTGPSVAPRDLVPLGAIGFLDAAANVGFGAASAIGLVSITSVLGSLYPVVTVILAAVLHGERLRGIQAVGVILAFVGAGAMSVA